MHGRALHAARIASVAAATGIALACGTNYAYSAWGPQFAERLQLSATQNELIGNAGNFGMYSSGIPLGLWIDRRGPRPAVLFGAVCLGAGYFPLKRAYDDGPGSMSVALLCFFSFLTGLGGAASFMACIKVSALNWPSHRGTATAFPLAAFGLSALVFSLLANFAFPDSTSDYLLLLAVGTTCLILVSSMLLRVLPPSTYETLPTDEDGSRRDSNLLRRTRSGQSRQSQFSSASSENNAGAKAADTEESNERSSLVSASDDSPPGDIAPEQDHSSSHHSHRPDVTGLSLLPRADFWRLFLTMGILTGVGLMTINNIGNDARALWRHYDDSVSPRFMEKRQLFHVSVLSFGSFAGRLFSGTFSDFVVKKLHSSRFWMVMLSGAIFSIGQLAAINTMNPNSLWLVSSLNGLGYGILFGVFPALVADGFGITGLSMNWGAMTLAPVFSANIFNLIYGRFYDLRSIVGKNGTMQCDDGVYCYKDAYWITFGASLLGVIMGFWCMRCELPVKRKEKIDDDETGEA